MERDYRMNYHCLRRKVRELRRNRYLASRNQTKVYSKVRIRIELIVVRYGKRNRTVEVYIENNKEDGKTIQK